LKVMIRLRAYRPTDFDVVRRWIDDPGSRGSLPPELPLSSDEDLRRRVDGTHGGPVTRMAIEADGRVVGEAQYWNARGSMPAGVFEIGIMLWDPADRGHGLGRAAQRHLVGLLFQELQAFRVQAGTAPSNLPERRCLEALGFAEEGTLRGFFGDRPDGSGDIVMYGLLRDGWDRSAGTDEMGSRT
jgi:RimJ/RimL family protein N-acetyltransferase